MILPRSFYARDTVIVARELLGTILVGTLGDQLIEGRIIETEAYRGADDAASHAYRGLTQRTAVMFGPQGHAYVYFIYGSWYCLNVTARSDDQEAGAVLIRGVEPLTGIDLIYKRRQTDDRKNLTNGPGKLAQACGLTTEHTGIDMTKQGQIYIRKSSIEERIIVQTPRIGISKAQDKLWRFIFKDV